jgi:phosphonate transport system substrate-binding protein
MLATALALTPSIARAAPVFRFGLTPVFLDNDAAVIAGLRQALSRGMGREIELVQRRTYQEITALLLERAVGAAWLCGYPYLQHEDALRVVAVPLWRGKPQYQSYLITSADDPAAGLPDLRGGTHAFSDPDSNSGFLVTATDLQRMGERPETFFSRTIFTYGHRNVVRAVADGLVRSGSVDGYVWEALSQIEPDLAARTRVIARSEWLGFPPVCARRDEFASEPVQTLRAALIGMGDTDEGRAALAALQLDGFVEAADALFDGISERIGDLGP